MLDYQREAIELDDEVVARFTRRPSWHCEQIAKALFNKGVTLGQLDRVEQEMEIYDDALARLGEAHELVVQAGKPLASRAPRRGTDHSLTRPDIRPLGPGHD